MTISDLLVKTRFIVHGLVFMVGLLICVGNINAQDANAQADQKSWPRQFDTDKGTIVVYQPQLDGLDGVILSARAAFSITKSAGSEPEFGAIFMTARVEADRENRMAHIDSVTIEKIALGDTPEKEIDEISAEIQETVSESSLTMQYDQFIAILNASDRDTEAESDLNNEPPEIVVKNTPAVLVSVDGKAKLRPVEKTDLLYVENSPFPIVLDPKTKSYFLNGGKIWYNASAVEGPWTYTKDVPDYVAKTLQLSEEQMDLLDEKVRSEREKDVIPEIVISFKPTELIVIEGKTEFTPIVGAELLYVSNSETPIFQMVSSKDIYILISGRWYKSKSLDAGSWEYLSSDKLPEVFARIPEDSDRGGALSHISGTEQAQEAITNASVPQVTAISREGVDFNPEYDGEPQFAAIKGTKVAYAINTASTVLKIANKFYAVDQGVWYTADSAIGPWNVADEVPEEVEAIPASSPVHNVKYVRIYDSTPKYVYVGYTPGYLGSYIYNGVVVYGTGYYYPILYPRYYYPRPFTWGFGVYYRPWYGWGYGLGWGQFYYRPGFAAGVAIGIGIGIRHNRWFGPGGYHSYRGIARRTARRTTYRTRNNIYNRAGNRGRNHFKNTRVNINKNNNINISNRKNNVFVDKSGNVLRKSDKGWQSRENGKWKNTKLNNKLPSKPSARPVTRPAKPTVKPNVPKTRPAAKPNVPKTRPAAKPNVPKTRPAAKPVNRAARPATKQRSSLPGVRQPSRSHSQQMSRQSHSRNRGRSNANRSRQVNRAPQRRSGGRRRR